MDNKKKNIMVFGATGLVGVYLVDDLIEHDYGVFAIGNKRLNDKYYSTKGKKRGLGLYIVNRLLRNSSYLVLEQSINKKIFTSKITINKKWVI